MLVVNIDMDGVLANFNARYKTLTGVPFDVSEDAEVRWGRLEGLEYRFYEDITPCIGARDFVTEIFDLKESYGYEFNVRILSALPTVREFPTAWFEKVKWVAQNIHPYLSVCIARSSQDKQRWANPGDILIDDNPLNVEQWNAAGGIALLHRNFDASLEFIEDVLSKAQVLSRTQA